jgi:hypothetical protein
MLKSSVSSENVSSSGSHNMSGSVACAWYENRESSVAVSAGMASRTGGSLMLVTVILMGVLADRPPLSVTVMVASCTPMSSLEGVKLMRPASVMSKNVESSENLSFSAGSLLRSGSVALTWSWKSRPCQAVWSGMGSSDGGSFTFVTLRENVREADAPPVSVTVTVTECFPTCVPSGVKENRPVVASISNMSVSSLKVSASPHFRSGSEAFALQRNSACSTAASDGMGARDGGSLTLLTVMLTGREAERPCSSVTVILALCKPMSSLVGRKLMSAVYLPVVVRLIRGLSMAQASASPSASEALT